MGRLINIIVLLGILVHLVSCDDISTTDKKLFEIDKKIMSIKEPANYSLPMDAFWKASKSKHDFFKKTIKKKFEKEKQESIFKNWENFKLGQLTSSELLKKSSAFVKDKY